MNFAIDVQKESAALALQWFDMLPIQRLHDIAKSEDKNFTNMDALGQLNIFRSMRKRASELIDKYEQS